MSSGEASSAFHANEGCVGGLTIAQLDEAIALAKQGDVVTAVVRLERLQERIAQASIFSRNESLDDVATSTIPFLALEHELAKTLTQLPLSPESKMRGRLSTLMRACDLWSAFFQTLENLEFISDTEKKEYHALLELSSTDESCLSNPQLSISRDVKIARFNAKKQVGQEISKLKALLERRSRLGLETEYLDGQDHESLQRSVVTKALELAKQDALEEWSNVVRELPMLAQMVQQQEQDQQQIDRFSRGPPPYRSEETRRSRPHRPLQLTHITQNSATGQLVMKKEEIRSNIFKRGWNQPTMSLEELAEREVAAARQRDEKQAEAEAAQKEAPRRYEFLKRDGLEDNADLVDASAQLDRDWDNFKDENPRGSGNKRGDVGDRNF